MEACVRGFSFMPETTVEITDLQYIESGELERTWKTSRRQRLKEQEQKVWDEFVREQDIVKSICKDDPYQFLHQLPESCLKELMEAELQKAKKEIEEEEVEQPVQGDGDHPTEELQHVTFAEEQERDDCDMFHIFDDEKDDPSGPSGPEDEVLNGSLSSPCTVRDHTSPPPLQDNEENESPENVSNVIKSSIYCAKVKDLRIKISEEILAIIASLHRQDVMTIEREEVSRVCRISAQFSNRFNRIHMYQLQRQMAELSRHQQKALPFARHTHFHALMVRVVSLHQNLLQAFQVFHKSMSQTACVRQSAGVLHALSGVARHLSEHAPPAPTPTPTPAPTPAAALYHDELLQSCDRLDEAVCEYSVRVADFLSTTDNTSQSQSRKSKGKRKRGSTKSFPDTEGRLSMYSLDTIRLNLNAKSSSSRDNHSSGTSKLRGAGSSVPGELQPASALPPATCDTSPRGRRTRGRGRARARGGGCAAARARAHHDADIATMVEAVGTCTSSHISREASPHPTPRRRTADNTPRTGRTNPSITPRKPLVTPRQKLRTQSPKAKVRRGSPKHSPLLKALGSIKTAQQSDTNRSEITAQTYVKDIADKFDKADKHFDNDGKHFEKGDKYTVNDHNNFDKSNKALDKRDKNLDKACKDVSSGRDFDSKGISENDLDGWKYFESNEFIDKNCANQKDNATSSKDVGTGEKESGRKVAETPRSGREEDKDGNRSVREKKASGVAPARCEVTRLLKQLCSGDATRNKNEKVSGVKNAQLLCVSGGSPRPPSTPQLLRILEETIQKKAPKPMYNKLSRDPDRFRMSLNIPDRTADALFQYRTKFVQHMLASSLYANSAVGKPWEMIGSVSEKIIEELLAGCAKEMEIRDVVHELYRCETN